MVETENKIRRIPMKNRKRALSVFLAAALAVTALGGCSAKDGSVGESIGTSGGQAMGRYLE